jgi:ubiquinone/menaquinone biosynthesis C-methylase UbiE
MTDKNYWAKRSKDYNNLEWVNRDEYMQAFIDAGSFNKNDIVLDVGCGTGKVVEHIAPLVNKIIGMDISRDMIAKAVPLNHNVIYMCNDIKKSLLTNSMFTKVTARHVFHHITKDADNAMRECYRLLKKNGLVVLSEGVPPTEDAYADYKKVMLAKETRIIFTPADLIELVSNAGFYIVDVKEIMLEQVSVKNWLVNSGLSTKRQDYIYDLVLNTGVSYKLGHKMTLHNDDCYIDMRMMIVVGQK